MTETKKARLSPSRAAHLEGTEGGRTDPPYLRNSFNSVLICPRLLTA